MRKQLLASELKATGFAVSIYQNGVLVTLKNRKPSQMEVETALEQIGLEIGCKSTTNGVFVEVS